MRSATFSMALNRRTDSLLKMFSVSALLKERITFLLSILRKAINLKRKSAMPRGFSTRHSAASPALQHRAHAAARIPAVPRSGTSLRVCGDGAGTVGWRGNRMPSVKSRDPRYARPPHRAPHRKRNMGGSGSTPGISSRVPGFRAGRARAACAAARSRGFREQARIRDHIER